jgi:hypothetical protein
MALQKNASGQLLKKADGTLMKECCCDDCYTQICSLCDPVNTPGATLGPTSWFLEIIDPIDLDTDCCDFGDNSSVQAQAAALTGSWCVDYSTNCRWEYDGVGEGVFDVYTFHLVGGPCTGDKQTQGDLEITIERNYDGVTNTIRVLIVSDNFIIFDGSATLAGFGYCDEPHDIGNDTTAFACESGGGFRPGKGGTVRITPCACP